MKESRMTATSGHFRIVVGIIVASVAVCITLFGVNIWRSNLLNTKILESLQVDRHKLAQLEAFVNVSKSDPLQVYKPYFKRPEEIERKLALYCKQYVVNTTMSGENCTFVCQNTKIRLYRSAKAIFDKTETADDIEYIRKRRSHTDKGNEAEKPIYHACCKTIRKQIEPRRAKNLNGIERDIVQTLKYKQHFTVEECHQVKKCDTCKCRQPLPLIEEAVVYVGDEKNFDATSMELDYIVLPGCCKCLNIK